MTRRLLAAAFALLMLTCIARAQDDLHDAAERYIRLPAVQQVLDFVLGPTFLQSILSTAGDRLDAGKRDQVIAIATEEMARTRPRMENAMVEAAAGVYTLAELEAMIAFYSSEVGASTMVKTQAFSQAYMAAFANGLRELQITVENRIQLEVE